MTSAEGDDEKVAERSRLLNEFYTVAQWKESIAIATLFAFQIMKKYGSDYGITAETMAGNAVSKLFNCERQWKPHEYTLSKHLMDTVRSDISHHVAKAKLNTSLDDAENELSEQQPTNDPELLLESAQQIALIKRALMKKGDEISLKVVMAYEQGGYQGHENAMVAEAINVSVNDVVNSRKRIRRVLKSLIENEQVGAK